MKVTGRMDNVVVVVVFFFFFFFCSGATTVTAILELIFETAEIKWREVFKYGSPSL